MLMPVPHIAFQVSSLYAIDISLMYLIARKVRKLLSPTKALRNLIPEEEQSFMAKRLAYTDPYYNRYLEDNQISGTCEHERLVFQVY